MAQQFTKTPAAPTTQPSHGHPATAKPAAAPPVAKSVSTPAHDDICRLAYTKWEAAGRPDGDGVHFWLEAEAELTRRKA